MSKPGKSLRNMCKKLGVRLTVKRNGKRVYKSVKVLKRQCANKKKKKVKKKRKFGGIFKTFFNYKNKERKNYLKQFEKQIKKIEKEKIPSYMFIDGKNKGLNNKLILNLNSKLPSSPHGDWDGYGKPPKEPLFQNAPKKVYKELTWKDWLLLKYSKKNLSVYGFVEENFLSLSGGDFKIVKFNKNNKNFNNYFKDGKYAVTGSSDYRVRIIDNKYFKYLSNKSKKDKRRKRRFGTSGTGDVNTENITFRYRDGDIYIGQMKDGKKHGQGKMTYTNGDVYEGQWVNNKKHGQGEMTYTNGDVYEGQWVNNKKHGNGIMVARGESISAMFPYGYKTSWPKLRFCAYKGNWKEDKRHGDGTQTFMDEDNEEYVYEGQWKNDMKNGEGLYNIEWKDYSYDGQWKDNNPHGEGSESTKKYNYDGQFKDGKKHGKGKIEHRDLRDMDVYEGEWKDGKKHGKGKSIEKWQQGGKTRKLVYDGEWKDGMKHGKGVCMYYNFGFNWIKYEGDWNNEYKEGKGIMTWSSGRQYTGEFKRNKKHGKGVEKKFVGEDLKLLYKGNWVEDTFITGDYHLYQNGVYEYIENNSSDGPDGSAIIVKTVEDATRAREGLQEFNKVQANFSRERFGKRRKKIRKKTKRKKRKRKKIKKKK